MNTLVGVFASFQVNWSSTRAERQLAIEPPITSIINALVTHDNRAKTEACRYDWHDWRFSPIGPGTMTLATLHSLPVARDAPPDPLTPTQHRLRQAIAAVPASVLPAGRSHSLRRSGSNQLLNGDRKAANTNPGRVPHGIGDRSRCAGNGDLTHAFDAQRIHMRVVLAPAISRR